MDFSPDEILRQIISADVDLEKYAIRYVAWHRRTSECLGTTPLGRFVKILGARSQAAWQHSERIALFIVYLVGEQ